MVHLLSATALNDQLPKLLPGIMQLYKKHSEHYYISQCLCMVVDAAGKKSCTNLELQLNNLLTILFQHACVPVDSTSSTSIKNHNEILRCFAVTGLIYSNHAVGFLLQKLEVAQEKVRVPTLEILKHIINSCGFPSSSTDEVMAVKKSLVVSGLKIVLNEQSLRVRRILCQVIIAMAHHDYLSLEGGQLMVEFVVRQCSLNTEDKTLQKLNTTEVTIKGLRDMSDNVLLLVTTTIEHMKEVLWPYLLEFVVPVQYTGAVGIVSRCIADIGKGKREEEADDYDLNFDELANIPRQPELIARLIVLAGHPHNGQGRGEHILHCMTALVPNLHEDLVDLWDAVIPKLLSYLNEQSEKGTWDQKHWEDLMLKFVSRSLDDVKNEEWLIEVGSAMGEKELVLERYMNYPEEKGFLFKCLGVIMRKVSQRQFIQKMLDSMFSTIKHSNQAEREGCAIGVGFCAASHLDLAVSKLEQVIKEEMVRKSKGFFGFSKDKSEADVERIKATVLLCYGYVTFHSPPNLITSRIEVNILRSINPHFNKIRDTVVKQNLIRTIDLIGRALHPDHLKKDDFIFSKRGDLLNHLLDYIHGEPVAVTITTETRALAINALTTLVKLDPQLSEAEQFDVIKAATDSVFPLLVMTSPSKKDSVTVEESTLLREGALSSVTSLLIVVLSKQFSSGNLYSIFKSSDDQERNRGVLCFLELMKAYQLHSDTDETSRELEIQGELLGRMVPRCTDPSLDTRLAAIDCVQMILRVSTCDPGVPDQMVDAVTLLRDRAESDEANILYSLVNDLSKVFCKKVADRNLWSLMTFLLEGLVDSQAHSSSAACVVLNNIVKLRGGSLGEQIPDLVDGLHEKLDGIYTPQTRTGTLRCMRTICSQYLVPTISHLLDKPLPWDKNLVAMWHILAGEAHLLKSVFLNLLEVLSLSLPYQEKAKGQGKVTIIETTLPKAASNAVGVLCETEEAQEVAKEMFAQIFSSLILRIGVSVVIESTKKPLCVSVATDSLKQFLKATGSEVILDRLESNGVWPLMEKEDTCPHSMLHLARLLSSSYPDEVGKTVECLSPSLTSVYDAHRTTVVSFYSELVCTVGKDHLPLAEQIMNNLLGRQVDSNYVVRMYCIRGLGNMADIGGSQVSHFSTTILSAMLAGMDDREDPEDLITMEAMSGLSRIFSQIDEGHVRPILINIALRIRPCFEKACKEALQKLGPLMKSENINTMFQRHLDPAESLFYPDFLNDLCKHIVTDFTDKVNFYIMNAVTFFKSMWSPVKANAALLVGYILGNLPLEKSGMISKEHVCEALTLLLKDPSPDVRASTAEAMSLLYDY
ncbi:Maestro heat-like repeat-containing protein family member 1 [Geodia barretti]|uniref:Maestro heat-like repeat-containing protein family member 1 n=1 Tax=Geodia barretti TaxID=519541 RepID=A0AA35SBN6_GEOBA|nr:Maestro heat-like repeat-containing protein family member 1 [Geodia barretti]